MAQQRRHGQVLKEDIYKAALEILKTEGYDAVTFLEVAKRAKTSRSVIYRLWENPFVLIYEASNAERKKYGKQLLADATPDKGSLRADLDHLCHYMVENAKSYPKDFIPVVQSEIAKGNVLIDKNRRSGNLTVITTILDRAKKRGEISGGFSERVKLVIFDILRYHLIYDLEDVNDSFIKELVDHILLPIYQKSET